jgi:hypothetical protein
MSALPSARRSAVLAPLVLFPLNFLFVQVAACDGIYTMSLSGADAVGGNDQINLAFSYSSGQFTPEAFSLTNTAGTNSTTYVANGVNGYRLSGLAAVAGNLEASGSLDLGGLDADGVTANGVSYGPGDLDMQYLIDGDLASPPNICLVHVFEHGSFEVAYYEFPGDFFHSFPFDPDTNNRIIGTETGPFPEPGTLPLLATALLALCGYFLSRNFKSDAN